jgi:hypothetical protein
MTMLLSKWLRSYVDLDQKVLDDEEASYYAAHREWLAAKDFFDYATDPDLVDCAIHSLQAAEKRYVYLWKRARQRSGLRG